MKNVKEVILSIVVLATISACSDWRENVTYDTPIWSDKGDKIAYHKRVTLSRSSYLVPGPGGDETKTEESIEFVDSEFTVLNNIVIFNENNFNNTTPSINKFWLLFFSEYENFGVYQASNVAGSYDAGIFKIMDLNGNNIFSTLFIEQKHCFDITPYSTSFIPALIPSPDGKIVLNSFQEDDCRVIVEILDARDNFSIKNTFELPALSNGKIAWSEDGNIIVQSTKENDQKFSWKLFLDGKIESYEKSEFVDECFTPPTASHYVSRDFKSVYFSGDVGNIAYLKDESENIYEANGAFYLTDWRPLNVFGCQDIKTSLE